MSRNLTAAMVTALSSNTVQPVFFAKFEFPSDDPTSHVFLWTGKGDKTWNGDTYSGLGDLGNLSFPQENSQGATGGVVFGINGIPSNNTSLALTENYQNFPCYVWLGALDDSGSIIADPYLMFSGLMDVMEMTDDGSSAEITLKAEGFAYGVGPSNARYTDEDQQREFPGDTGLEFVAGLQSKEVFWGIKAPSSRFALPPNTSPGGNFDDLGDGYDIP